MMPTHSALSTLSSNTKKGRKATDVFRAAFDKAKLDDRRGQVLNENKAFPAALLRLIHEHSMPMKAPEGGRIHVLSVPVNPNRKWDEAVKAAGPDTCSDWDIWKVTDSYPPQAGKNKDREIILVNFSKTIQKSEYVLEWAKPLALKPASPRAVFAISEHKPQLHKELGFERMAVVSLEDCSFDGHRCVPYVVWGHAMRDAHLIWFGYGWNDDYWFAFVRE